MDAEDKIRSLRRSYTERRSGSLSRLISAAAESPDPAVRAAWAEYRAHETVLAELSNKREEE